MRWIGRRQSDNVEDRRGMTSRRVVGGGCGTLILLVLVYLLGGDPLQFLQNMPETETTETAGVVDRSQDSLAQFVSVVLADIEDVWGEMFRNSGSTYQPPKLVLYNDRVQSACGFSSAATGPFYCPGDYRVYIDLYFLQDLQRRFRAPGDFAVAYILAHEVGHHVQNLIGITDQVNTIRGRVSEREYNRYSVAMELQADFLAGVWAHHAQRLKQILEPGDIEEALNAASAVGDDRIMKQTQGYVVPDAFTHGTSAQRQYWFRRGFETGDINQGDTFSELGL
ncbi:zinc metallopeptidase [bacterium]|nr:zinc metallopeptidase [bacterium]